MSGRIRTALSYTSKTWREDTAARGAGKMAAGALLIADAVFNIRARLNPARRVGRRSNDRPTGILGSLLVAAIGVVLLVVGLTVVRPSWSADAITTSGEIVGVEESVRQTDDGPERTYTALIAFTDQTGQRHEFTPGISSSSQPRIGTEVEVTYEPANPVGTAQRTDGFYGRIHWAVIGAGGLFAVFGFTDFLIRSAMIGIGIWLFAAGRRERAEAGETGKFLSDLRRLVWDTKHRQDESTQAGIVDTLSGSGVRTAPDATARDASVPQPAQQTGTPPGWYASPTDGPGILRWWDGTAWTEHTHATPPSTSQAPPGP